MQCFLQPHLASGLLSRRGREESTGTSKPSVVETSGLVSDGRPFAADHPEFASQRGVKTSICSSWSLGPAAGPWTLDQLLAKQREKGLPSDRNGACPLRSLAGDFGLWNRGFHDYVSIRTQCMFFADALSKWLSGSRERGKHGNLQTYC